MSFPRNVYAIFPLDESGKVAGVYVGSTTKQLSERIRCHLYEYQAGHGQKELHELMRKNGYECCVIDHETFETRYLEFDWIQFFEKHLGMKVFNYRKNLMGADWRRCLNRKGDAQWLQSNMC